MHLDAWLFRLIHRGAGRGGLADRGLLGCARYGAHCQVGLMILAVFSGVRGLRAVGCCLSAVALIYALTELVGVVASRPRPFAVLPESNALLHHSPRRSFPSRHVASAVAMALIIRPAAPGLGTVMGVVALGLAGGRIRAGVHYPSDVAAGALLGTAVARLLRSVARRG